MFSLMWTRRKTVIAGETRPDDWIIRQDGREVGRVHASMRGASSVVWFWASWTHPARCGHLDSLEEAQEAVRQAVLASTGQLAPPGPPFRPGTAWK